MLKVMIADDEAWVLKLIKNSIDWKSLGMEIVCEATDGQESLDKIKQFSPDIVISDVRMPVIDGVTVAKLVKDSKLSPKFIMLSGYQDFEYVQKALRNEVSDYLLKPYDENTMLKTLKKVKTEIYLEQQHIIDINNIKKHLNSSIDKLKNNLLSELLYGNVKDISSDNQFNKEYRFNFQQGIYQVIYIKRTGPFELKKAYDPIVMNIITTNINKEIKKSCHEVSIIHLHYGIAIILNYPEQNVELIESLIAPFCYTILQGLQMNIAASTAIGIGSCEISLSDLARSMYNAEDSANCMLYYGCNRVYDIKNYSFDELSISNIFSADKQNQFICIVETFNTEELSKYINTLFKPLLFKNTHPRVLMDLSKALIDILYNILKKIKIINDMLPTEEIAKASVERCSTCNEIPRQLIAFISEIFTYYHDNHPDTLSSPVQIAKKYISIHYSEPIKLQDIAQMVYLSPQYFSELFKRDMGCNFSDYLSRYRIEVSKELLLDPRYRIKDINYMVGYKDSKSFSKLFKQHMGISPLEYRKLHI